MRDANSNSENCSTCNGGGKMYPKWKCDVDWIRCWDCNGTGKLIPDEKTNFDGSSLCSAAMMDKMREGRVEGGMRYLGKGSWQKVNHDESRTNERLT